MTFGAYALSAWTILLAGPVAAGEPVNQPQPVEQAKGPAEPTKESMTHGKDVYLARCAVCHKADGVGGTGGAPGLVANSRLRDATNVIIQILNGGEYMPAFAFVLSDGDVAAVATYIRNSWGNHDGAVNEAGVTKAR
jgi:mono/diheme cytochrome c family protein